MTTTQTRPVRRGSAAVAVPEPRRPGDLAGSLDALEPAGDVPLHLQLRSALDRAVDASGLAHGERIWSESQLMRHYKVSRHVVRQALNQLVLEGRLSVRKGAGYFVNRRRVVKDLQAVVAPTGQATGAGTYEVELLESGIGPTFDAEEADLVPRRHRPRVHRVRRLARIDGEPVALLTAAFPVELAKVLPRRVVAGGTVLPALSEHGSRPSRVDLRLEVTFASGADRVLLEVAEGAPLVMIRSRLCAEDGELVAVTRQLYRTDRFQFAYAAELGADGWAIGGR
jgi:DNA-binding GntR family transcriptional regulator